MSPVRIFIPLVFLAIFVVWLAYHLIIKKDLKKQKGILVAGSVFSILWGILYCLLII